MKKYQTVTSSLASVSDPWAYISDRLEELIEDLGGDPEVITQYSRWNDTVQNILYMLDQNEKYRSDKSGIYPAYADSIDIGEYICEYKDGEFVEVVDLTEGPYGIIFELADGTRRVYQEGDELFVDESKYEG